MIRQLIYLSELVPLPPGERFDRAIAEIHSASRQRNSAINVTGLLLFNAGYFLQVLEGFPPVIERLFDRIRADRRHRNVERLADYSIPARVFGRWSMGLLKIDSDSQRLAYRDLVAHLRRHPGDDSDEAAVTIGLLRAFGESLERPRIGAMV